MSRRAISPREILAIDPRAIQRDAEGIFLLFGDEVPENESIDGVSVVHVRGPLDHHRGFGDSYDAIRERFESAFADQETHAVVVRLDSPGGVVAGLLDTVRRIRAMSEACDKRVIAYVDEGAFSAAYALACACDEIVLPPSAICGSIGVISTMADQVEMDRMLGLNVVTITSGERKADGHPHVRISADSIKAERGRVDKLALQFFRSVSAARGLSVKAVRGFQARLFLGQEAVDAGTADRVETFDQLLSRIAQDAPPGKKSLAQSGTTRSSLSHGTSGSRGERNMKSIRGAILEELKLTKAALAKAKVADKPVLVGKVAGLEAALQAYKKVTEKHVEHQKTSEEAEDDEEEKGNETDRSDDPEDDEKDEKDEDEEASAKPPEKKAAASRKSRYSEEDEEEASSEDDEAEALAGVVQRASGPKRAKALASLHALQRDASAGRQALKEVAQMRREQEQREYTASIASAGAEKRLTPNEVKRLRAGNDLDGKALDPKDRAVYLKALLHSRPKSLVWTSGEDLPVPAAVPNSLQGALPDDQQKLLNMAIASSEAAGLKISKEKFIENYRNDMAARGSRNGAV